jgi:hypothetical protein
VLLDREANDAVQRAVLEWATSAGVAVETVSLDEPLDSPTDGLAAAVVAEDRLAGLEEWLSGDPAIVVLDAASVTPTKTRSTLGPSVAYDEAGFLAGVAAGLATGSGIVGILAGGGTEAGGDFGSGFEEGLLYSCPGCELSVADLRQPAFAMDVIGVPPGAELTDSAPQAEAPWIVVVGQAPTGDWAGHVAARVRAAPEALISEALDALLAGESGEAWSLAASNGGLVTEIDERAISPGRERLLREAETALAQGYLVVGDGQR